MLLWFIPLAIAVGTLIYFHFYYSGIDISVIMLCVAEIVCFGLLNQLLCAGVCDCANTQLMGEAEVRPIYAIRDVYLDRDGSCYNYTVFEESKGLSVQKVNTSKAYINYTTEPAYVEIYKTELQNPVLRFLFQFGGYCSREYYFYIPETAEVVDDFVIDLS